MGGKRKKRGMVRTKGLWKRMSGNIFGKRDGMTERNVKVSREEKWRRTGKDREEKIIEH